MNLTGVHILSSDQFSREDLDRLFDLTNDMLPFAMKEDTSDLMTGKILATLFFEPSTRTRFSFETAMLRLGGKVINNNTMSDSSAVKKGETLEDTARTVSEFADVIVARHPEVGALQQLADGATVPVISGGDGPHDHPTQGLLDLYTILKEKGALDGLTVGLVGDLKYSRVLHSQCKLLSTYKDVTLHLISPEVLQLPGELKERLVDKGLTLHESTDLESVANELDVLSINRIQHERFVLDDGEAVEHLRGSFVINEAVQKALKKDAIIICPLPRREEVPAEVDRDPRARYFKQIEYGVAVRMALMAQVLGISDQ